VVLARLLGEEENPPSAELVTTALVAFVCLPLAHLKDIGVLAISSAFSVLMYYFFGVIVVVYKFRLHACRTPSGCTPMTSKPVTWETLSLAVPTMCFSFLCHTQLLPVFEQLKIADAQGRTRRDRDRIYSVVRVAVLVSFVIYLLVSFGGYLTFYDSVSRNILDSYMEVAAKDMVILGVELGFCISLLFSIPLNHFPMRRALTQLLDIEPTLMQHVALTTTALLAALVLALCIPAITFVMALFGATSAVSLVFILPGLLYIRLSPESRGLQYKLPAGLLAATGVVVGCVSLAGLVGS
jgi:amino acid permease